MMTVMYKFAADDGEKSNEENWSVFGEVAGIVAPFSGVAGSVF